MVIPVWDKTLPTIVSCLDTTLRRIGGVPTYALTVSVDHVAGIAVRNPELVEVARHDGLTIRTCVPADPQTKAGSKAAVRIAKAVLAAARPFDGVIEHPLHGAERVAQQQRPLPAVVAASRARPEPSSPTIRSADTPALR